MQTCQCSPVIRIVEKPSGFMVCGDCGMPLPLQPPAKKERP